MNLTKVTALYLTAILSAAPLCAMDSTPQPNTPVVYRALNRRVLELQEEAQMMPAQGSANTNSPQFPRTLCSPVPAPRTWISYQPIVSNTAADTSPLFPATLYSPVRASNVIHQSPVVHYDPSTRALRHARTPILLAPAIVVHQSPVAPAPVVASPVVNSPGTAYMLLRNRRYAENCQLFMPAANDLGYRLAAQSSPSQTVEMTPAERYAYVRNKQFEKSKKN